MKAVQFSRIDEKKFFRTLNKRVNGYFKEHNINKTGNWVLYSKAILMFALYIIPLVAIFIVEMPQWLMLIMCVLAGVGMAGIGMNVMHDGNHESFSSKKWVNKLMGGSMYFLAGNAYNWKIQHNILHHTFTNIKGLDEDIDAGRIIRFSMKSKWLKVHRFQIFYAPFLYGLLTINWALTTDIKQLINYSKNPITKEHLPKPAYAWLLLIFSKIIYYCVFFGLPLFLLEGVSFLKILLGYFIMHYTAGIILSFVFQLAHIVPETDTPLPNEEGKMANTWAIHQLFTTANFAPQSKLVGWLTGGLNHQVEHHIFPHISHVHYHTLAKIVRETAKEFGLPYYEHPTFGAALAAHLKQIKNLGMKPAHV